MLISLFFSFPQRYPSPRQGPAQGAGKWSICSYHSARSTHTPTPGGKQFPRSPARSELGSRGCADTDMPTLHRLHLESHSFVRDGCDGNQALLPLLPHRLPAWSQGQRLLINCTVASAA